MFGTTVAAKGPPHNPNMDVEMPIPADIDGISSLNFSPTGNFIVATSWNTNAYLWEYSAQGQTQAKSQTSAGQPLLCSVWRPDGAGVFIGGCDKAVRLWDLATNQSTQVRMNSREAHAWFLSDCVHLLPCMQQPKLPDSSFKQSNL